MSGIATLRRVDKESVDVAKKRRLQPIPFHLNDPNGARRERIANLPKMAREFRRLAEQYVLSTVKWPNASSAWFVNLRKSSQACNATIRPTIEWYDVARALLSSSAASRRATLSHRRSARRPLVEDQEPHLFAGGRTARAV
jgi:hypothetical protein